MFIFVIAICADGLARFIRVDRSCVLASREFDFCAEPGVIGTFLYRLSKVTPAQRGEDTTVAPAFEEEVESFHAMGDGWPVYKLTIPRFEPTSVLSAQSPSAQQLGYLVGQPRDAEGTSLADRPTRGFAAYDLSRDTADWVKDVWKIDRKHIAQSEREIYQHLWAFPDMNSVTGMHIPSKGHLGKSAPK
ncbi:hypothetical protein BD413DRAFT_617665 [Trametes elegans]|nr:hypothetical protein BD413DRAFT_617665 [Trametes elegans]